MVNISKLKRAHGPWSPALPNTVPNFVRDANDPQTHGADPDKTFELRHTSQGKFTNKESEFRSAETENSSGKAGSREHGKTPNTGEVPTENPSESPAALQKTDGHHHYGQGADTDTVSLSTTPLAAGQCRREAAGANGQKKRRRGRSHKINGDLSANKSAADQANGHEPITAASHDSIGNKQRGQQGRYNLRRQPRPNYASFFNYTDEDSDA